MPKQRIFISYRRSDTAGHAGRLYDYLKNYFGAERVFFDVDTIEAGTDFEKKINAELDHSQVVLVLIGKAWLNSKDAAGNRRLDDRVKRFARGSHLGPVDRHAAWVVRDANNVAEMRPWTA